MFYTFSQSQKQATAIKAIACFLYHFFRVYTRVYTTIDKEPKNLKKNALLSKDNRALILGVLNLVARIKRS